MRPGTGDGRSVPVVFVVCLGLGCVISILLGQDANWDLQNYHLYNPHALLTGRLGRDITPAGLQSLFNPLLDVPYYWLARGALAHWPRLLAAVAGVPYGLLVFLTWRIARHVPGPGWPALVATAIGVSGTTVVAEIGTSFGDIPTADLLLAALLLILEAPGRTACLAAGLLAGAAVGLKPTTIALAPGLLLAVLPQPRRALLFSAAGAAGVAITWGWWGAYLAGAYGNPFAPFLNQLFRSPWFALGANIDRSFMPHDPLQWIAYPFYWLGGRSFVVSETSLRDARFACTYLSVLALGLLALRAGRRLPRAAPALLVFFCCGFVLWEAAFSIIRYAVALEALSGCVIMLALRQLPRTRAAAVLGGSVVLFILCFGNYAGWGRVRGYRATVLATPEHALPPHSLVVIAGAPRAFMALSLPGSDSAFIGTAGMAAGTQLWTEAQRRIAGHVGPIFVLVHAGEPDAIVAAWGLRPAQTCQPLPNPYQRDLQLCPAERAAA